eukprot:CAMPEP_0201523218 /NCGR_PEP_ID=MMETSP0161_2-20130828/19036_1 /ASSEMBLY_ACC=CAM_ASM_000251 /TAXON_ID=180227 /ORGANISM="Neoparamoeba aestuarina, Strain SoJaBio B1-5/56/2" /LENGTH=376 /DNA_ID=CAMNT_0047922251 /DNA_START=28 /DNA_END=1158 /DNA_ORIENTATION=-
MAWFNPADLNNQTPQNDPPPQPGAGTGSWFNPADLNQAPQQQPGQIGAGAGGGGSGAWYNPADLGYQQQEQQHVKQQREQQQQQLDQQKQKEEEKQRKKEAQQKKKEERERKKIEREQTMIKEREEKERERYEEKMRSREKGVDYTDEFHGPWEFKIMVVEATDLEKRADGSPPDPYVKVKTYAENLQTRSIKKTANPTWKQPLSGSIMDPLGKDWTQGIMIEVLDYTGMMDQHRSLGVLKLCLGDLKHDQENDIFKNLKQHKSAIVDDKSTPSVVLDGKLHVVISCKGGAKVLATDVIKKTKQATMVDFESPAKSGQSSKATNSFSDDGKKVQVGKGKKQKKSTKKSFADNVDAGAIKSVLDEEDEPESDNWTFK